MIDQFRRPPRLAVLALLGSALGSSGAFAHPGRGIAVDPSGAVFVADAVRSVIWKISPEGVATVFAPRTHAHWLTLTPDGKPTLYAEHVQFDEAREVFPQSIVRFTADGARTVVVPPRPDGAIHTGTFLKAEGDLFWWAIDGADLGVRIAPLPRDPDPGFVALANLARRSLPEGSVGEARTQRTITGMAWTSAGGAVVNDGASLWHVSARGEASLVVSSVAKDPTAPAPGAPLGALWGVAIDTNNNLYTTDPDGRRALRISGVSLGTDLAREAIPREHARTEAVCRSEGPWFPTGVATRGETLYILEHGLRDGVNLGPRVRVLEPGGAVRTLATIEADGAE